MKKLVLAALVLALVLSLAGCGLFSDSTIINLDDAYTHHDPDGLKYDTRVALKNGDFGDELVSAVNSMAWPDTMMYDDDGGMIGMYDYDPETGLAYGWIDLADGSYHAYDAGEEVELGLPDESMTIALGGTAALYAVVYGNEGAAVEADMYILLSDASDRETVLSAAADGYLIDFTAESDTVLKCVLDADTIADDFALMEEYGETYDAKDADAYADILMLNYNLRSFGTVNPYKPYAGAEDPADVEFDEKIVLTGSGAYSLSDEKLEKDLQCRTDVLYGLEGETVAMYTYFEFSSADTVDQLLEADTDFFNPSRVSDTVILDAVSGSRMEEILTAYEGYGIISDHGLDTFADYMEECYFSMRAQ